MRAVIAGAGAVGASIARELHAHGHEVVVVEARTDAARKADVGGARLVLGDACDLTVLEQCGALEADVLVAATGDDRVNLVYMVGYVATQQVWPSGVAAVAVLVLVVIAARVAVLA